jgi:hypothetical protein
MAAAAAVAFAAAAAGSPVLSGEGLLLWMLTLLSNRSYLRNPLFKSSFILSSSSKKTKILINLCLGLRQLEKAATLLTYNVFIRNASDELRNSSLHFFACFI